MMKRSVNKSSVLLLSILMVLSMVVGAAALDQAADEFPDSGEIPELVPEFPTIALPVAVVIGLVLLVTRGREE